MHKKSGMKNYLNEGRSMHLKQQRQQPSDKPKNMQPRLPAVDKAPPSDADDIDAACGLHDSAVSYRAEGKYDQAESLGLQALMIFEKAVGPKHPDVANILNNLAGIHVDRGEYAEAERLYQRSVSIMEKVSEGDADIERLRVQSLSNLAEFYRLQGRNEAAESLFKRALAIKEKLFGPNHPEVAMTLNKLAVLYKSQGRYTEAKLLYQRSLSGLKKALGPSHPNVTACSENYAQLLREMHCESEAPETE